LERGQKIDCPEEPDYRLHSPSHKAGDQPLALCVAYPWDRFLDGKDATRDAETPDHNPGQRVVSLLEKAEAPWIVMTNGRLWRLYSPNAPSRASNYYEVDLADALGQSVTFPAEPGDAFRYFWLLFRHQSFEPPAIPLPQKGGGPGRGSAARDGKQLSVLDRLFEGSREFATRLGENLKERVFEQIFQILAEGFIAHIRQSEGRDAELPQERLDAIFHGVLTLLYRLLYAEARDLLPVKETREYQDASLSKLKSEVQAAAGPIRDGEADRLQKHYRPDTDGLWQELINLFRVIDRGDPDLNVPRYNGGLFLSKVERDDASPEATAARFLNEHKVPDPFLAHALDLLARDEDPKQHKLVPIDFKSLGVRQLGSIYEGLLEFKLRIADEKKAIVREKSRDVYVSFKNLGEKERERAESQGRIVKKGQLYLENDKGERKATGSYYTPDHIVEYIVENAVGPVVAEKFEAMRARLRDAEQWHHQRIKSANAKGENPKKYESGPAVDNQWYKLVNDLFDIKVLDPAMGSGHFLVETVDYITDKALAFLNSFLWNPVTAHLDSVRSAILDEMEEQGISIDHRRLTAVNLLKRHVLKRCIYGVDLNPMAVELAKVSLWLHCFTLGAPLSFLDHHMRCGNSLIGVSVQEVQDELRQGSLFGTWFAGMMLATEWMGHVGELSDVTTAQVDESKNEYRKASEALAPFKRILDVYASQWFGNAPVKKLRGKRNAIESPAIAFLTTREADAFIKARTPAALQKALAATPAAERRTAQTALASSEQRRFFHWELEFPEIFYGPRPGTERVIQRLDSAGFDAVVGNPPYDVLSNEELFRDLSPELGFFRAQHVYTPAMEGKSNLFKLFVCRAHHVTSAAGLLSLIVPMSLLGDEQTARVRRLLLENAGIVTIEAFPQKDDPRKRIFPEAKLATTVLVARSRPSHQPFTVRTHAGREIADECTSVTLNGKSLLTLTGSSPIPMCTQRDWQLASQVMGLTSVRRLGNYCQAFQGEINETSDGKKGFVSYGAGDGPLVMRGSMICMYAVREASQGEPMYLHEQKYLKGKPDSVKAWHHGVRRVGWQESSPLNNFRRIIAAPIPEGVYCNHKINYIPESASALPLDFVLALLNSSISDWFFRLQSSNAAVSHYQVLDLPAPTIDYGAATPAEGQRAGEPKHYAEIAERLCASIREPGVLPAWLMQKIARLSRDIQRIESRRALKARSERSALAPDSQHIQDAIDRVLFHYFGLAREDSTYIQTRLVEML
jgi:hypothetical protein